MIHCTPIIHPLGNRTSEMKYLFCWQYDKDDVNNQPPTTTPTKINSPAKTNGPRLFCPRTRKCTASESSPFYSNCRYPSCSWPILCFLADLWRISSYSFHLFGGVVVAVTNFLMQKLFPRPPFSVSWKEAMVETGESEATRPPG